MSIEYSWDRSFSPAEAERGKFLPIDTPTISSLGYPLSGRGKYASMVYITNPEDLVVSIQNVASVSGSITISQPNSLFIASSSYKNSQYIYNPAPALKMLEIYNKTSDYDAYVMLSATSFDNLTAWGMPIVAGGYYSVETEINAFTVGSELSADLRIMGHYRS